MLNRIKSGDLLKLALQLKKLILQLSEPNSYSKIKSIKASVGGFFQGSYDVEIEFDALKLTWRHYGNGNKEQTVAKKVKAISLNNFIEQLKIIDLLNWDDKYVDERVLDGTQWNIEIIADAKNIRIYGSNKFPDKWKSFCEEVEKLSGREFR